MHKGKKGKVFRFICGVFVLVLILLPLTGCGSEEKELILVDTTKIAQRAGKAKIPVEIAKPSWFQDEKSISFAEKATEWTAAVTSGDWLQITTEDNGSGGVINVEYQANAVAYPRTGEITVTAPGCAGSPAITKVEQEGTGNPTETFMLPGNISLVMVWVPEGDFMMGRYDSELHSAPCESPQHQVTFAQGFWIGKYEVTQSQWGAFMDNNTSSQIGDNYPIEVRTLNDIQNFIAALNEHTGKTFQLPSEAQWEYAARAGTSTRFYWGDDLTYEAIDDYAWYWTGGDRILPQEVGKKQPNAWGLFDMSGNVLEWCQDWYHDSYDGAPTDGSAWMVPVTTKCVFRGGDCDSRNYFSRSAWRMNVGSPDLPPIMYTGFRLVWEGPPPEE